MDYYAVVSIIEVVLKLITVIILPFISYDKLIFYGLFTVSISALDFCLNFIYSKRHFEEISYVYKLEKSKFREMLSFTGWNLFGAFAFTLQGQGLNVLINSFFGPVVNAARGVTFQIHAAINGFSENIATAFRPQLVESYAKQNYDRTQNLMFSMSKYCYIMIFLLSIPVLIEIHNILNLWLNGTIPEYTIPFTFLVITNMMISCLNLPISQTVQATGKVKYYQIIRSVLISSTLPIAWIFLHFGADPTIVFWVTLCISVINQPLSMTILHRLFDYSYIEYFKAVIIPCVILTIIAPLVPLIIHFNMSESFLRLVLVVVLSIISSVITVYLFVFTNDERISINNIILKKINKKSHDE